MSDIRCFYFDDGKSRKRWHVRTKGKSQTVHYGRLNGALRESKKSFGSPAAAKDQTEKLISKKKREGYIEVEPSRLEIVRPKGRRKATEKQIKVFEERIGCKLPEEYRCFLSACNGGQPNPDCVDVPGRKDIDNVGVGALFHLQPSKPAVNELSYELEHTGAMLPDGHLPIAGSSDVYTVSLKPKTFGCVFWWFHESNDVDEDGNFMESAGYLLAGSFDEFLTRIALVFGDDEETDEARTPRGSSSKNKPKATVKRLLRLMKHDLTPDRVKEVIQVVDELQDISGIDDGEWPFGNISNARVLRHLLDAGLNPEILDSERCSLLWQCAGCPECVDLLLKQGVKVDRRSGNEHETALMRAMYLESIPSVRRLLKAGANPTVRLSWPIKHKLDGNSKLLKLLEQARSKWKSGGKRSSSKGRKAVVKAASSSGRKKGPKPTLRRLLQLMKHDYITDECDEVDPIEELIAELGDLSGIKDGEWPVIDKFESPRLLKCLLKAGLNPELTDKSGNSLLSQCVTSPESIALLLRHGASVDRRSGRDNGTALMRATWKGDEECVRRLLKAGADPTLEFTSFAKVMLGMDEEMTALIETACAGWKRKKRRAKTTRK